MNRRTFVRVSAAGVVVGAVGSYAYAVGVEPHWLEIVFRDLAVEHLPRELEGARLAHLSDLHIGLDVSDEYIAHSFQRVKALAPDIVVFTGDFITYTAVRGVAQFDQLRRVLSHFPTGRIATLGILGNHDYGDNWSDTLVADRVVAEADRVGMQVLRNQTTSVKGLDFIGVDDLWGPQCRPEDALASRQNPAAIALVHNPDTADHPAWSSYQGWLLAGHTHGGQCKPPFLPPPLLPVRNRRYVAGEVSVGTARSLYISRGVGHLLKARFNVRPEITMFTLRGR